MNPYCELHLLEQNVVLSDLLSGFPFWPQLFLTVQWTLTRLSMCVR